MLIRTNKEVKPHVNPILRIGHTYQILSAASYDTRVGRVFTMGPDDKVIYLTEEDGRGGWDHGQVLEDHSINYKEVDLTLTTNY